MPYFRKHPSDLPVDGKIYMLRGSTIEFKVDAGPNKETLIIKAASPDIVQIKQKRISNKPGSIITITGKAVGTAVLQGYIETGSASPGRAPSIRCTGCISPLTVEVLQKIELPNKNTEAGAVTRMLLAENYTPESAHYNEKDSLIAMQWMRNVLENRLAFSHPHLLQVPHGSKSFIATIKGGSVEGFRSYPTIQKGKEKNITDAVKFANHARHPHFLQFRKHVENAIAVANGEKRGDDPCPTKLYAWKSEGSPAPSSNFVKFRTLVGQDFYTLTPNFIKNPLHPDK